MGNILQFRRRPPKPPKPKTSLWRLLAKRWFPVLALLGVAIAIYFVKETDFSGTCDIKGNISVRTGERIYHVPGDEYYDRTQVNASHGERWFCSEAEAEAVGWRRSLK